MEVIPADVTPAAWDHPHRYGCFKSLKTDLKIELSTKCGRTYYYLLCFIKKKEEQPQGQTRKQAEPAGSSYKALSEQEKLQQR